MTLINEIVPRANPFRFKLINYNGTPVSIDYNERLPILDMMDITIQYQAGIYPKDTFPPIWKIDKEITLQIEVPPGINYFKIYNESGFLANMTYTNITPIGWVGYPIYKLTYTPTSSEFYYIIIELDGAAGGLIFQSDSFYVSDSFNIDKDIIELQFHSDENINGFIFDDWYTAFYTGQYEPIEPEERSSTFEEDTITKLASISFDKIKVTLSEQHMSYFSVVYAQIKNKKVKINGIPYIYKEGISIDRKDKSDLVNIIFELTADYDNNYMIFI